MRFPLYVGKYWPAALPVIPEEHRRQPSSSSSSSTSHVVGPRQAVLAPDFGWASFGRSALLYSSAILCASESQAFVGNWRCSLGCAEWRYWDDKRTRRWSLISWCPRRVYEKYNIKYYNHISFSLYTWPVQKLLRLIRHQNSAKTRSSSPGLCYTVTVHRRGA